MSNSADEAMKLAHESDNKWRELLKLESNQAQPIYADDAVMFHAMKPCYVCGKKHSGNLVCHNCTKRYMKAPK